MNVKADKKTINEALDKVCAHSLFVNSSVYTRLLRYLVEKAIQKEDIKEYTIGAELFGKNYASDKNDGTVRTHMYKLRKKLASYYSDKSIQHAIVFEIKKGQYNVAFISKKEYKRHTVTPSIHIPVKYLKFSGLAVLMLICSALVVIMYQQQAPVLWKSFMKARANNLVIISDQYVLMETNQYNETLATMYPRVNSDEDLLTYKKEHPERKIDNTDFTLMTKMAPYSIKTLDEWFLGWNSNYKLQLESGLSLNDIKENNIVFIGQFKTMNLSNSLFLKDSEVFSTYGDGFKVSKENMVKIYNTQFAQNEKVEYAIVSFTSLNPSNKALFFVSNNDIGVMATLRNFTDKAWLKEFYQQLPTTNCYFNALFEVSGIQRTDMSCKLVELEILQVEH